VMSYGIYNLIRVKRHVAKPLQSHQFTLPSRSIL
jgi:hypothetical protein